MMTLESFKLYFYSIYGLAAFAALFIALRIQLRGNSYASVNIFLVGIFCILLCILYGGRSILVGTDTGLMMDLFNYSDKMSDNRDPFINFLIRLLKGITDAQGYIAFLSILYIGNIFLFIKNRKNGANKFLFFFLILSLFFFKSMGINIVRQGVSIAFFLNAFNYYEQRRKVLTILFALLSIGFHTTAIIPILLFFISTILQNKTKYSIKIAFGVFILASVFSILEVNFFNYLPKGIGIDAVDARSTYYTNKDDLGYQIGFRPTFFMFNVFFIGIALYNQKKLFKKGFTLDSKRLQLYLIYFLLASSLFFTAFQIPFSDRWGLFSWVFIPLLLEPLFQFFNRKSAIIMFLFSVAIFVMFELILQ